MCNESPPALGDHLFLWLLIAIYRIYKKKNLQVNMVKIENVVCIMSAILLVPQWVN